MLTPRMSSSYLDIENPPPPDESWCQRHFFTITLCVFASVFSEAGISACLSAWHNENLSNDTIHDTTIEPELNLVIISDNGHQKFKFSFGLCYGILVSTVVTIIVLHTEWIEDLWWFLLTRGLCYWGSYRKKPAHGKLPVYFSVIYVLFILLRCGSLLIYDHNIVFLDFGSQTIRHKRIRYPWYFGFWYETNVSIESTLCYSDEFLGAQALSHTVILHWSENNVHKKQTINGRLDENADKTDWRLQARKSYRKFRDVINSEMRKAGYEPNPDVINEQWFELEINEDGTIHKSRSCTERHR